MKNLLCFILLLVGTHTFAQKKVQGIILDVETNKPIEYVMLIGNNSGKSTVTNYEGRFNFNMPKEDTKLIIKHINYFTKEIKVSNNQSFQIKLQSSTESLEEIVILKTSIKSEIEKAIKTSQDNFAKDLKVNAFYREMLYINGEMYEYEDADLAYFLQNINKSNVIVNESRNVKFTNNEAKKFDSLTFMRYHWTDFKDIVSHEFNFKLIKDIISNKEYDLFITSKKASDGTELFILNFKPIQNAKKAILKGTMVYGANDYLIREIKTDLDDLFLQNSEFAQQNNHRFKKSFYNQTTIFKLFQNKYTLAYTSYRIFGVSEVFNQLTKVGGFKELLIDSVEEKFENPNKNNFYIHNTLKPLGKNYSTKYWEKFNVVPLTFKEEQFLKKINQ